MKKKVQQCVLAAVIQFAACVVVFYLIFKIR